MSGNRRSNSRTVSAHLLAVLDSFSPEHSELSLVEISRRTGLAASASVRLFTPCLGIQWYFTSEVCPSVVTHL